MAFQGATVICGYIRFVDGGCFAARLIWTRSLVSGQVTNVAARHASGETAGEIYESLLGFEITSDHDIFVAWGKSPNAALANGDDGNARMLVRAGETRNVICREGDLLMSVDA